MTKTLDLGCGPNPNNPFQADEVFGVDLRPDLGPNIRSADLAIQPIPFPDAHFEFVTAYNFIEHIPRVIYMPHHRNPFIELMNEIHRVLMPGGAFISMTPAYPHPEAFQDPTHVNIITEATFTRYFDDTYRWAAMYGFRGSFTIVKQEWMGFALLTQMRKTLAAPAAA